MVTQICKYTSEICGPLWVPPVQKMAAQKHSNYGTISDNWANFNYTAVQ